MLEWLVYNSIIGKASDIHIEQYKSRPVSAPASTGSTTTIYTVR
jgi:hypothetical protein